MGRPLDDMEELNSHELGAHTAICLHLKEEVIK